MTTIPVERELLERAAKMLRGYDTGKELRALLAEQPQAGAGQPILPAPWPSGVIAARHDQGDEVRRLREALERARYAVERGEYATGCCCCGSSVASHGLGDGHSPVDEGDYFKLNVLKDIDAALSAQNAEETQCQPTT